MSEPVHIISLGAGVQSSTMALMAAHGEITPMPIAAVFADTQDEPASVMRWLDWIEKELPFPVHRVTNGRLSEEALITKKSKHGTLYQKTTLPLYTLSDCGSVGRVQHRSCTVDYKVGPLTKKVREIACIKRGQKVLGAIQWIGISLDELQRMKPSREAWCEHRWPLIEMRMTRDKCLDWMLSNGYPKPPRSACYFCPFHSQKEWRRLQLEEPEEFARAVEFEKRIQERKAVYGSASSTPFLHRSCKPLDTIDFRSDVEMGQGLLWQDECEGMCGV
jgi:hypothetical protein